DISPNPTTANPHPVDLGQDWMPFLRSWRDRNVEELRSFADDVVGLVDASARPDVASHQSWNISRIESRKRLQYVRYATERDQRKEVKMLARRLFKGPTLGVGSANVHTEIQESGVMCDWMTTGELGDFEESESSEESEGEGMAVEEYLVWW
ncbi:hypothetical protein P7C70_g4757, partial [Phenoliferia sp. Uapishka_3]